jgi:hypothetical protein
MLVRVSNQLAIVRRSHQKHNSAGLPFAARSLGNPDARFVIGGCVVFTRIFRPGRTLITLALLAMVLLPIAATPPSAGASSILDKITSSGSVTGGRPITIRVSLTRPAPVGGALTLMSVNHPLINVITIVVPAGLTSYAVKVGTVPTFTTTLVTITGKMGTLSKSSTTLIKEPYLSSLSVQSVIRAGGYGKVTPRISGPAPAGGVKVTLSTSPDGFLSVPVTATIPAGQTAAYLVVPASMVDSQVAVNVKASYDGKSITTPTVVRNMGT